VTETADTRQLSETELAAWIPFSGRLIGLLAADKPISSVESVAAGDDPMGRSRKSVNLQRRRRPHRAAPFVARRWLPQRGGRA
jgi:hypothetical protein